MGWDEVQEHRRKRLRAAAERLGSKAALGRALDYQDGSHVGQMLRGERPITDKTVAQLEALPGFADWFGPQPSPQNWPFPLVDQARWESLSEQERGYIQRAVNQAFADLASGTTQASGAKIATLPVSRTLQGGGRTKEVSSWWQRQASRKGVAGKSTKKKRGE